MKAISSGNPLLLTLAEAEQEVQRLSRLERSHATSQRSLQSQITRAAERIEYIDRAVPQLDAAQVRTTTTKGDAFAITFRDGRTYTDRASAASRLQQELRHGWTNPILSIAGHQVHLDVERAGYGQYVDRWTIPDAPDVDKTVRWSDNEPRNATGTITRLENLPEQIGPTRTRLQLDRAEAERTIETGTPLLGQPFKHTEALAAARAHYRDVEEQIHALANQPAAEQSVEPHMPHGLAQRLIARAASIETTPNAGTVIALDQPGERPPPEVDGPGI